MSEINTEKATILTIFSLLFFFLYSSWVHFAVHEFGHYIVGTLLGGNCTIRIEEEAHVTTCYFEKITKSGLFLFSIAGIAAEILLAILFFSVPEFAMMGGSIFLDMGFRNLMDVYEKDLIDAGLVVFAKYPMNLLVFAVSIIIYIWSIIVMLSSCRRKK